MWLSAWTQVIMVYTSSAEPVWINLTGFTKIKDQLKHAGKAHNYILFDSDGREEGGGLSKGQWPSHPPRHAQCDSYRCRTQVHPWVLYITRCSQSPFLSCAQEKDR